jgi:hypothetical protein
MPRPNPDNLDNHDELQLVSYTSMYETVRQHNESRDVLLDLLDEEDDRFSAIKNKKYIDKPISVANFPHIFTTLRCLDHKRDFIHNIKENLLRSKLGFYAEVVYERRMEIDPSILHPIILCFVKTNNDSCYTTYTLCTEELSFVDRPDGELSSDPLLYSYMYEDEKSKNDFLNYLNDKKTNLEDGLLNAKSRMSFILSKKREKPGYCSSSQDDDFLTSCFIRDMQLDITEMKKREHDVEKQDRNLQFLLEKLSIINR